MAEAKTNTTCTCNPGDFQYLPRAWRPIIPLGVADYSSPVSNPGYCTVRATLDGCGRARPREGAPILVFVVSVVPKKTTEVPIITTRLTTLHTPCDTGLTRDSVLNANCAALAASEPWNAHSATGTPSKSRVRTRPPYRVTGLIPKP